MRLDAMNQMLGLKTPAQIFKNCPKCKCADLLEFEGEVFCNRCPWDSVIIHAEALAAAMASAKRGKRAKDAAKAVTTQALPATRGSTSPALRLFLASESPPVGVQSPRGKRPEVA